MRRAALHPLPRWGIALAVVGLVQSSALARRLPAPGGRLTLSLPTELVGPTIDAHIYAPLLEPERRTDSATTIARPAVKGLSGWRSAALRSVTGSDDGTRWRLEVQVPAGIVADSLTRCLVPQRSDAWPAQALLAHSVTVEIKPGADVVELRFSQGVGPVPELLSGCSLRGPGGAATGAFASTAPAVLTWRSGAVDDAPLLGAIEIRPNGERADVSAGAGETTGNALLAPFSDVVLILQGPRAVTEDPLRLRDAQSGPRAFKQALRADLIAAAWAPGRSTTTEGLLPPGLAPARPLPVPGGADRQRPLLLTPLPAGAPTLVVRRTAGDPLVDGIVDRLAVILRDRGIRMEAKATPNAPLSEGLEVLRWRPPTSDAALALLAFAGQRPELFADGPAKRALENPMLLSPRRDERLAAALSVERAWIDAAIVVPALNADRWFIVDAELRGVSIRADGVPLLQEAYFVEAQER